ncbi:SMI1/KNR4 family protein [Yinghuangia sp. YIM S10712]|uniref:SMI1/KNR4 family protein n=1 Tax=Yinghuangia sp. YIM S10712 TaxID=3436930 RepID=UPI003F53AE3F
MAESTAAAVTASWSRIDTWLAAHAPASLARLPGGAEPAALAAVEKVLGIPLPEDLAASLRCHDGVDPQSRVLPQMVLLSAQGIIEQVELRRQVMAEYLEDDEPFADEEEDPYWHPLWVPVAHFQGDLDVIDMRPGPGRGRLGWASHDGSSGFAGDHSLGAFLQGVADTLMQGGGPTVDPRAWDDPLVSPDGELVWGRPPLPGRRVTPEEAGYRPAPVGLPG